MNNPNPLIPQGSLLEQKAKSKPHLRIALCIVAVHVIFLGLLLMQGCKREDGTAPTVAATNESPFGALDVSTLYNTNLAGGPATTPPTETVVTGAPPTLVNVLTQAPPIVPSPLPPEPASVREYTVAPGDSFYSIGKKLGVTSAAIAKANPGVDPNRLQIGQKLVIPPPTAAVTPSETPSADLYVVKPGDNLTRIARLHNTTAAAIRELNGLQTDRIYAGQKLKLPPKTAPSPAPAPGTGPTLNP
jgi:LysM repeat protein